VPKSFVLGPLLFLMYTLPLKDTAWKHNISFHIYADENQLYLAFRPIDAIPTKLCVQDLVRDIKSWMIVNLLKLNNDKTKFLLIYSRYRPAIEFPEISIGDDVITPSESV